MLTVATSQMVFHDSRFRKSEVLCVMQQSKRSNKVLGTTDLPQDVKEIASQNCMQSGLRKKGVHSFHLHHVYSSIYLLQMLLLPYTSYNKLSLKTEFNQNSWKIHWSTPCEIFKSYRKCDPRQQLAIGFQKCQQGDQTLALATKNKN